MCRRDVTGLWFTSGLCAARCPDPLLLRPDGGIRIATTRQVAAPAAAASSGWPCPPPRRRLLITGVAWSAVGPGRPRPRVDRRAARGPRGPAPTAAPRAVADRAARRASRTAVSRSPARPSASRCSAKPTSRTASSVTAPLNLWPAPAREGQAARVLDDGRQGRRHRRPQGRLRADPVRRPGPLGQRRLPRGQDARRSRSRLEPVRRPLRRDSPPRPAGLLAALPGRLRPPSPGLTPSAVRLFRSVCNAFPALTTYGGYDAHGEHSSGRAIDFMTSDSAPGSGRRRLGPRARLRARPLRRHLGAAHLDAAVR